MDRRASRALLKDSLDRIFAVKLDKRHILDSVEPKLFGIGVESCTIGSFEFYLGYAVRNNLLICLDMGHYHPTESVADKVSSVLFFLDEILLHVSRPVRWDSDHVVTLSDELQDLAREIVRGEFLDRVHIGLDFFDASINRIAAWVIGTRSMLKALLAALLEPRRQSSGSSKRAATSRPGWRSSKSSRPCRSAASGTSIAAGRRPGRHRLAGGSQELRTGRPGAQEVIRGRLRRIP